jgi:hypothetical protein
MHGFIGELYQEGPTLPFRREYLLHTRSGRTHIHTKYKQVESPNLMSWGHFSRRKMLRWRKYEYSMLITVSFPIQTTPSDAFKESLRQREPIQGPDHARMPERRTESKEI